MTGAIVLSEYQDQLVALGADDAAFVATQFAGRITIRRAFSGDAYLLNPRQFVGLVRLPSGRRLECRPKVPVRNLFYMVAVAYDLLDPFIEPHADMERVDDILEVMAGHFTVLVEERLRYGVYRAYVEEEGNLSLVRGRIAIADDIRSNYILRHRTYCRYTEYSWDVPENQVLRQVARLLAGYAFGPPLRHRLRSLDASMEDITPGRYVAADLDRFTYNRLNLDYRPLHRLCRLFLDIASSSGTSGSMASRAFLLDMNRLFEAFTTRSLAELTLAPYTVHAQQSVTLDVDGRVPMRPDMVVRKAGADVLVADCKYKRIEAGKYHQHDVYQVLAYCTALHVPVGLLIYPQHLAPVGTAMTVKNADMTIVELSVNLGGDLEHLRDTRKKLADSVARIAAGTLMTAQGQDRTQL